MIDFSLFRFIQKNFKEKSSYSIFIFIFFSANLEMIAPIMMMVTVNPEIFDFSSNFEQEILISILLAIFLIKALLSVFVYQQIYDLAFSFQAFLSNYIFRYFMNLNFLEYKQNKTGKMINLIIREPSNVTFNYTIPLYTFIFEIFVVLSLLAASFYIDFYVSLILLIVFTFITAAVYFFTQNLITKKSKLRIYFDAIKSNIANNGLSSFINYKFNSSEMIEKDHYQNTKKSAQAEAFQQLLSLVPRYTIELVFIFMIVALYIFLGDDLNRVTILSSFAVIGFRLMPSITRISSSLQLFRYSQPIIEDIKDVLSYEFSENKNKTVSEINEIKISNLNIKFDDKNILEEFNYTFKKGNIYCLTGESGKGKTTLLHHLAGLYDCENIMINNSTEILPNMIRDKISYMDQNVYIPENTLSNFLELDQKIIFDNQYLKELLSSVNLNNLLQIIENENDPTLGRSGLQLSGGEKQRLNFVKIILEDKPIILMDEPTSGLDKSTEKIFFNVLNKIKKDKIIITVTHSDQIKLSSDYEVNL